MDCSPFAKLPPELRIVIFEHALTYPQHLAVSSNCNTLNALSQTCRQIHQETAHLIFQLNTFILFSHESLVAFIRAISPSNAIFLRHLIVEIHGHGGYFGQDSYHLRSAVHDITLEAQSRLPQACAVTVWPVMLADRRKYSDHEFEWFMKALAIDVRDVVASLRRAVDGLKDMMKTADSQGLYRDLFWAKRLFGGYLKIEVEEDESKKTVKEAVEKHEGQGRVDVKAMDSMWAERIFEICLTSLDA